MGPCAAAPQKLPYAVVDIVINSSVRQKPRAVGKVVRPGAQYTIELALHLVPWRLVARPKDPPDASLDPLHCLLGWRGTQVPMSILPVPHRTEGVTPAGGDSVGNGGAS